MTRTDYFDTDHYAPDPDDGRGGRRGGNRKRKRKGLSLKKVLIGIGFTIVLGLVGAAAAFAIGYAITPVPDANKLVTSNTSILYWGDGQKVLGTFSAQNRITVPLDQVPKHVQDAVLAAENRTFWTDKGISPTGIVRAMWAYARGREIQGGSTITQQYVKNYYLTQDRTWQRKVRELFITLKVQRSLSKQQILQDYLNTIYFGRGAYGIQVASRAYFGKDVQKLTPQEGAIIASVIRAPALYDPSIDSSNKTRLEGRFRYILRGMAAMGDIPAATAEKAGMPAIKTSARDEQYDGPEGYLLVSARKELLSLGFTEREIEAGGLRVRTTFDPKAQAAMVAAFNKGFPDDAANVHAGGASVRPGTGEVVAMYGGTNYLRRQFNDATQAKIPPGSSFKPFALAAALEKGISLKSRFAGNSPFEAEGVKVNNEGDEDYGRTVDLLRATEDSINTAYVDLTVNELGPDKVVDSAIRAGVPKESPGLEDNPQVALGSASVNTVDMANAYATFAAGGERAKAHLIAKVTTRTGEVAYEAPTEVKREFKDDVVRDVTYALSQVVEKGSGKRAQDLDRPAAGKTGTHEGLTAWFVGFTPQLSTAVGFYREGNGGLESLDGVGGLDQFTGGRYPAQIWTAYMKAALEGQPVQGFDKPAWIGKTVDPKPKPTRTGQSSPNPEPSREPTKEPTKEPTREPDPDPSPSDPPPTQDPDPDPEPSDPPPTQDPDPDPGPTKKPPTKAPSPPPDDDGNPSPDDGAP